MDLVTLALVKKLAGSGGGGTGTPGKDGKSAYEIAIENGFDGTEEEWLDSLKGADGTTPDLQIGTVETLEPGSEATVSITGTSDQPVLSFGIPEGVSGKDGNPGQNGAPGKDGKNGTDGFSPIITENVDNNDTLYKLDITTKEGKIITPNLRGENGNDGIPATISIGNVTTGNSGTNASVTNTGTASAAVFNFTIPAGEKGEKGDKGDKGDTGEKGDPGTTNYNDLTNKPTINGVEVSGDKTSEDYKLSSNVTEVDHGISDTTFELPPNQYHTWGEVTSLTLTLGTGTSGQANGYWFSFDSGDTATTLSLPETIQTDIVVEPNMHYECSIVGNYMTFEEWEVSA